MWVKANPNPLKKEVPDCVIRAISIALNRPWVVVYDDLCAAGYESMKEQYGMGGMSYENRRGYIMDGGPGYSGRYGRSMTQGYSGHYPMMPEPYYYEGRQW